MELEHATPRLVVGKATPSSAPSNKIVKDGLAELRLTAPDAGNVHYSSNYYTSLYNYLFMVFHVVVFVGSVFQYIFGHASITTATSKIHVIG